MPSSSAGADRRWVVVIVVVIPSSLWMVQLAWLGFIIVLELLEVFACLIPIGISTQQIRSEGFLRPCLGVTNHLNAIYS
jgi:hypothetical protein